MIEFTSIQQMLEETSSSGLPLWDAIRQADCQRQGISPQQSWDKMAAMLQAMEDADRSYQETDRSHSGLSGGDGGKMARYIRAGKPLCGPFLSEVMAGALRMGECNACMKRIVAAPTAGACGCCRCSTPLCQTVSSGSGQAGRGSVCGLRLWHGHRRRASISGAEGGCQAEIGSAAAMAAPPWSTSRAVPRSRWQTPAPWR